MHNETPAVLRGIDSLGTAGLFSVNKKEGAKNRSLENSCLV